MTKEEAIKKLQKQKIEYLDKWVDFSGVAEAFDKAINALEQEPCEDAISREAVLNEIYNTDGISNIYFCLADKINALPPVKPAEKVGWWIIYDVHGHKACKCSECDMDVSYPCNDKFCKYCGSKMQEV